MLPKWLEKGETPKRKVADKWDKNFAKKKGGKTYANSGATFGQNDLTIGAYDFETKFTQANSYSLKIQEFKDVQRKAGISKIAVEVIRFLPKTAGDSGGLELAVIDLDTLMLLIEKEKELARLLEKST